MTDSIAPLSGEKELARLRTPTFHDFQPQHRASSDLNRRQYQLLKLSCSFDVFIGSKYSGVEDETEVEGEIRLLNDYLAALVTADEIPGFPFMDLSPELRNRVYQEVLILDNSFTYFPQIRSPWMFSSTHLLGTLKELRFFRRRGQLLPQRTSAGRIGGCDDECAARDDSSLDAIPGLEGSFLNQHQNPTLIHIPPRGTSYSNQALSQEREFGGSGPKSAEDGSEGLSTIKPCYGRKTD
ncbi:uncharacterized protein MYCGRDRAFT_97766 [Zymoseptoria tritici IPO323]|uniref:Uncharacterized protein n=1 Tax=Zymoseptoria tritici (strain CBS 115943 / IPO323) TaxID=336722 RepID=F9XRB1_ZYMTI|nr:uncharacterized protein MYCGRDRAFT_97766 [Zymoseptoria tritici IPO323]EGP82224.1 hypothetical protein MYCGRDRAFT_97766 [Zymoseptoria tritici IPO323]